MDCIVSICRSNTGPHRRKTQWLKVGLKLTGHHKNVVLFFWNIFCRGRKGATVRWNFTQIFGKATQQKELCGEQHPLEVIRQNYNLYLVFGGEFKYSVYLLFQVRIHLSFHSLVSFYICIVCLLLFFHQFVLLCNLLKIFFHFCTILHH